jgi:hypothetical protein
MKAQAAMEGTLNDWSRMWRARQEASEAEGDLMNEKASSQS